MDINIKMLTGDCLTMRVNPDDTVGSVKIRIQEKLGVACETQRLVFVNGHNTQLDDNSKPISCYGLNPGATLTLLVTQPAQVTQQPVQVFLRNDKGKTSTYDVRLDETVSIFKNRVQSREGVQASQQKLVHQGRVMEGGRLSDYGVREMSTIDLTLRLRGG